MRVGVDTGGTFTDCVLIDKGRIKVVKVFSDSTLPLEHAAHASVEGVRRVLGSIPVCSLELIHGTTLSTNSLLERQGARVALLTTRGFEDLIEIGRQARPRLYDLNVRSTPPLVARRMRWGVKERTTAGGTILAGPSERELHALRAKLQRSGAESVAVCLLFAFANPTNERRVARALRGLNLPISVSHQILPEFREYERLSTVTINAFLTPRIAAYLSRIGWEASDAIRCGGRSAAARSAFQDGNGAHGMPSEIQHRRAPGCDGPGVRVYVMESSGGITTVAHAAREPVRTILSGPAGGVAAASDLMKRLGIRRAVSFDMGGTSTDVCLLDGPPRLTRETTVGDLPVAVPVLDVRSVGAGGGSLARLDAGGALRVGPESAGALPGPVCYRRGGRQPTVTDANLILGRLDTRYFLGGTYRLDRNSAEACFRAMIQEQPEEPTPHSAVFDSPLELARGIIAVANANMERALRVISVERGHDPRDFVLIAFGGAGGLHAADLARSLDMPKVIVPPNPGTFSAIGILFSDIVKDASQSLLLTVPEARRNSGNQEFQRFLSNLLRRFRQLEQRARAQFCRDLFPSGRIYTERQVDIRYRGQSYELTVPFSPQFAADFERAHRKIYGYSHSPTPLEVINLRLRLMIPTPKPVAHGARGAPTKKAPKAFLGWKNISFNSRFYRTRLYDRAGLTGGIRIPGPAVVIEYSSTTVVPPDFLCRVDNYLNLILIRNAS